MSMEIGNYVEMPKFGNGIVVDVEVVTSRYNGKKKTGRYGVKLDNPSLWSLSSKCKDTAYFWTNELQIIA